MHSCGACLIASRARCGGNATFPYMHAPGAVHTRHAHTSHTQDTHTPHTHARTRTHTRDHSAYLAVLATTGGSERPFALAMAPYVLPLVLSGVLSAFAAGIEAARVRSVFLEGGAAACGVLLAGQDGPMHASAWWRYGLAPAMHAFLNVRLHENRSACST